MQVLAPAKINLCLRITGRRPDGFHTLETLMVPVGLEDELDIETVSDPGVVLECDDPTLPCDASNLAVRAAEAFLEASGFRGGVRIVLRKRIPHGAGLGGGSSDAGAVLRALDALTGAGLGTARLCALAATFGSDTPFFVDPQAHWCRGRGEILEPAPFPWRLPVVLAKPPFGVPTPWAYQRWKSLGDPRGEPGPGQPWGVPVNDLEPAAFSKFHLLPGLKRWFQEQPETAWALMSGSGSTVFAVAHDIAAARALAARVPAEFGDAMFAWAGETR